MKEKDPKWTKSELAYVRPDYHNPSCSRCLAYYDSRCTIVKGAINGPNGSCNFWAPRRTVPIEDKKYHPTHSKEESGYVETPGGPRCGTCKFYHFPKKCELIIGEVDPILGCCNAWQKDE